jgi:hypothetical protein
MKNSFLKLVKDRFNKQSNSFELTSLNLSDKEL